MAEVLIALDSQDGTVRPATAELLTLARQLGEPVALWAGSAQPSAQLQEELARWGVERIDWVRGPNGEDLNEFVARPLARAAAQVIAETRPRAVLASSTFANKEFAAHLGSLIGAGVLTDLSGVEVGADIVGEQTIFAGTWNATAQVVTDIAILLLKPGVISAEQPEAAAQISVREVAVADALEGAAARIVERTALPEASGPDLVSATTVVVGGRGTEGDFASVRELAEELGAAVGATRVATDEGWIDHSKQVGQTGVTITPRLYIGAGVSGAVHHLSGMQASEVIVAINADADAPLLDMADFGVVGDLHEVLPQAAAELRRLREK
ncbi:MAG TPA: electron transfer flavoprotein subunit alpha/FixB family protein [Actinomycetales bacterium]|nr:electron transfer flavoprotein subunit alpha/FixB family protein [Actinomycetales bacterium]